MALRIDARDTIYMNAALGLARRALGTVAPNPAVGCVLVRPDLGDDMGRVVGRGHTMPGGRPHAEACALDAAGQNARNSTAYVTLEPCAHHGQTPPCAEALINAGVARVVIASRDPDPRVDGGGIALLEKAGCDVQIGLCEREAEAINAGFFSTVLRDRPLVTIKTATTLDGRIATHTGESQWITDTPARARGHLLRATHDAILVGSGTVRSDNPDLTCRLPGLTNRSPVRVVLDGRLATPLTAKIVATAARHPTWIITQADVDQTRARAFTEAGVEIISVEEDEDGRPSLHQALRALKSRGITRLLVEAGGRLDAGFFRSNLVDRVVWFHAPLVIGGDGIPSAQGFGVDGLSQAPRFRRVDVEEVGADLMETYEVVATAN
jgi:diaminohydroxyphosphoribosylaminopyrimidine deaminase / 5-amino-6-(5-phosphoribosylamino)uracil reductase